MVSLLGMLLAALQSVAAQETAVSGAEPSVERRYIYTAVDSLFNSLSDTTLLRRDREFVNSLDFEESPYDSLGFYNDEFMTRHLTMAERDSMLLAQHRVMQDTTFQPVPRKATLLALIPGGGQIYNRKYWKLPIVYGGLVGCVYALSWNQQMYSDYRNAYVDIMDSDPDTRSYEEMLPPRFDIESNMEWLKSVFKNRKDKYRRYRDLSIFAFAGVYLISIIDAYVDAELSHFDISSDLSLKIQPQIMESRSNSCFGVQLAFTFK